MPNRGAPCGSRESAICDKGYCSSLTLPHYRRGRREHLAHTGPSLWSFETDDYDVSVIYPVVKDGLACIFLAVKDPCRAFVYKHLGKYRGLLYYGAQRSEGALDEGQSSLLMVGVFDRADDVVVHDLCLA